MLKSINFLSSIVTSKPKMVLVLLLAFLGIMSLFINEFKYLNNKIIIAPQGYKRSWNINILF